MHRLVFLGCGGVGSALLELIHLSGIKLEKLTIIDPRDIASSEPILSEFEYRHVQREITAQNLIDTLEDHVSSSDLVVDVSYNIFFYPLVQWCLDHNVMYINTSMERWPFAEEHLLSTDNTQLFDRSLQSFHRLAVNMKGKFSPTVLLEHGMNPGLITHFTKAGLKKVAAGVLKDLRQRGHQELVLDEDLALNEAYQTDNFPLLAFLLNLETVHCSERDTQVPLRDRKPGEFMNTWGAYSLYGEAVDPAQIGLGTHEKLKELNNGYIVENQLLLPYRGGYCYSQSYVPTVGKITGMLIPHGENDTISRALTLIDDGKVIYRPSNYYVYSPAEVAWESLAEVEKQEYKMLPVQSALRGYQLEKGSDAVGALLLFREDPDTRYLRKQETREWDDIDEIVKDLEDFAESKDEEPPGVFSYWSGTILSLEQTRKLGFRYAGPTTVQVATSLLSAIKWMSENSQRGVIFPEELPYQEILEKASPFLGDVFQDWVPYHPESTELDIHFKIDRSV